ncbi:F0F1 ATP synthase subunit A [bacterium]|nr:F0F1 ATP synthase subunit A [bacterium]MCI0565577.1 F0F1 ATP synthase subunit A [bacterium]
MDEIHIAIAAERLGEFFGIPITNTLITTWIVMALLVMIAFFVRNRMSLAPGKTQAFFEALIEIILDYIAETLESRKRALLYFPLLATIFVFVFTANVLEFTPGIGSIGFFHYTDSGAHGEGGEVFTPLLRSVNTDLNVTLALTLIAFLVIEVSGILIIGFFKYFRRFFNFSSVMGFFVGIIEFISELARLVSFSFRLFGNIFAGEVMIVVITFFVPFILPVPFMAFEIFVGFIQAAIFSLLTLFFIKLAITDTGGEH